MCYLVFVCLNLDIFFIALNYEKRIYGFLNNVLTESTLKVSVNTFSHVCTPPREREREMGRLNPKAIICRNVAH